MQADWKGRCKKIPREAFSDHQEVWFGQERVTAIQLLSMSKPKAANGYYHTLGRDVLIYSTYLCKQMKDSIDRASPPPGRGALYYCPGSF
jgi:hypothetical protein